MGSDGRNVPNPKERINENFTIHSNFTQKNGSQIKKLAIFRTKGILNR